MVKTKTKIKSYNLFKLLLFKPFDTAILLVRYLKKYDSQNFISLKIMISRLSGEKSYDFLFSYCLLKTLNNYMEGSGSATIK